MCHKRNCDPFVSGLLSSPVKSVLFCTMKLKLRQDFWFGCLPWRSAGALGASVVR